MSVHLPSLILGVVLGFVSEAESVVGSITGAAAQSTATPETMDREPEPE